MDSNITIPRDYLDFLQTSLPHFWEMNTALKRVETVKSLSDFYAYILTQGSASCSQLFQDTFVDFVFNKVRNKTFLEFGATNGIELSNSYMLESQRGWRGVLIEPDPQWHIELMKNRPNSKILTDCVYERSGEKMRFISSATGVLSSLKAHAQDDVGGYNAKLRLEKYQEIDVTTISLNDVFETFFNGKPIEYMSVDTEGSEYKILSSFDFEKYRPSIVTVEHNYTDSQAKLNQLFASHGYVRVFAELTNFDAWYVLEGLARDRNLI